MNFGRISTALQHAITQKQQTLTLWLKRQELVGTPVIRLDDAHLHDDVGAIVSAIASDTAVTPLDVWLGRADESLVLTADATTAEVAHSLVEALAEHGGTCLVFIDPDRLDRPGHLSTGALAGLIGGGVVVGLHIPTDKASAGELEATMRAGRALLERHLGYPVRTVSSPHNTPDHLLAHTARRLGFDRAYGGHPGLAAPDVQQLIPRWTLGEHVLLEEMPHLLASSATAQATLAIGHKVRAVRRALGTHPKGA